MNSSITKVLEIAAAIFFVCLLVTIAYRNYQLVSDYSKANSENLIDQRLEYESSGLATLEGSNLSGASVINAVKKYLDDTNVQVTTVASTRMFTMGTRFNNINVDGSTFIDPKGVFTCTHDSNLNGVITQINFIQKGAVTGFVEYDPESLRAILVSKLSNVSNVDNNSSIEEVLAAIDANVGRTAKTNLISSTGSSLDLKDSTIDTIADGVSSRLSTLQSNLDDIKSKYRNSYTLVSGTTRTPEDPAAWEDNGIMFNKRPAIGYVEFMGGSNIMMFYNGDTFFPLSFLSTGEAAPELPDYINNLCFVELPLNSGKWYFINPTSYEVNYYFYVKN